VLDFGKSEIEILNEIANIMKNETTQLEDKIKLQQECIMNGGRPQTPPEVEKVVEEPSAKELFEFKTRLEVCPFHTIS
jgi:hypothetical protein